MTLWHVVKKYHGKKYNENKRKYTIFDAENVHACILTSVRSSIMCSIYITTNTCYVMLLSEVHVVYIEGILAANGER
jgi:hypothetical protein